MHYDKKKQTQRETHKMLTPEHQTHTHARRFTLHFSGLYNIYVTSSNMRNHHVHLQ